MTLGYKHPFYVDTFRTLEAAREAYPHVDPERFQQVKLGDLYNHPTLGIVRAFTPLTDDEEKTPMKPQGPFHIVTKDSKVIQVWLGPPDDPESELVLTIDRGWIPALIAALKAIQ
jgi:hypothetical protein